MNRFVKDYHKIAIVETCVILIFTILPTISGFFGALINSAQVDFNKFYKSGEFLLYSVSLLSAAFLVYNKFKVKGADWRGLISMIIMVCLVLLSLFYALVSGSTTPNIELIKYVSLTLFVFSAILFYHSQVLSNKPSPDIGEQRNNEQEVIENALN